MSLVYQFDVFFSCLIASCVMREGMEMEGKGM